MRRRQLLLTAGSIAAFAGCTGADDNHQAAVDNTDGDRTAEDGEPETEDAESNDEPENVEGVIGTLVEGDNLHLVVEGVERTTQIGEFREADEGNEFVIVRLALKNVTDDFLHVSNLLQTRLRDEQDYSYDQTVAATENPTFNDGQFAPGELERGTIVFEIPDDASGLSLQFDFDVSIVGGIERATIDLEDETEVHELEQDLKIDTYDVGDAVEYEGVAVEVREVETETELGDFTEADEGHEFVIVDISITNETGEEQRISTALQMLLKDENGWSYQEDFSAAGRLDRPLDESAPLTDGETRAGQVAYHIEREISPLYWVFEFTLWTEGDKTFWQLR